MSGPASPGSDACAELLQRGDPDRWLSAMAAPEAKRPGLLALYAFNLELARAPWVTSEPMLAEIRLRWWAEAIEEIYAGTALRRHEVVLPLAEAIRESALPQASFATMIEARVWDAYHEPHRDRAAFEAYIAATAGNLMTLAARHLGAGEGALGPVADLGTGAGAATMLRAARELVARGRDPLPFDGPRDPAALLRGDLPPGLRQSVREIATEALARISRARAARTRVPAAALPALLPAAGATRVLARVQDAPDIVFSGGLEASEFHRRAARAWVALTGRW